MRRAAALCGEPERLCPPVPRAHGQADVDLIEGLCPAIALEQKVTTRTTRSTVGSLTEVDDYLRLLFARAGRTLHPETGEEVKRHEVSDVVDALLALPAGPRSRCSRPCRPSTSVRSRMS